MEYNDLFYHYKNYNNFIFNIIILNNKKRTLK